MKKEAEDYIKDIENKLKDIGISKVVINKDLTTTITGKSALNPKNCDNAIILTAKLEGFKDALNLLDK